MGDAMGREGKGGQAWLTNHLILRDMVQISYLHKKNAKDFIPAATTNSFIAGAAVANFVPGGTTQNSFDIHVSKRIQDHIELSAEFRQSGGRRLYTSRQDNPRPHLRFNSRCIRSAQPP